MNLRGFYRLSGGLRRVQLALAAWGLATVGLDGTVPIHWNVNGEADGFAAAWIGVLLVPVPTVFLVGLMALVPRIEPRAEHLRQSAGAFRTTAGALVVFLGVLQGVSVGAGLGIDVPVAQVIGGFAGVLFAIIGNVMTTVRSNFLFGVRTPWTLSSELAWDRTHRLVGRLFVVTGVATALIAVLDQLLAAISVLMVGLLGSVVVAFVYSWRVWRSDPDRRPAAMS